MNAPREVRHEFINLLPETLEEGVLYISYKYKGMVHLCFCGCRRKVMTPLSPTGWSVGFDGRTVTVTPSIGNWNLPCRSHYWIRRSAIEWAPQWSQEMIDAGFAYDRTAKQDFYRPQEAPKSSPAKPAIKQPASQPNPMERVLAWLGFR
jgi:hypothetical protein